LREIWSKIYISPGVVKRLLSSCSIAIQHYLIICKFYEKIELNLKCVSCFPLHLFSETFFIIIRNERGMFKNVYLSSRSAPVIVTLYKSFSTLSHNRHVLRKNGTESKRCVLIFSKSFAWKIFNYNKKWAKYGQKYISLLA
jgi:hypothetical protein